MSGTPPFVVVVAAAQSALGCSTLAWNLPVYLRALAEDLPLALLGVDAAQQMTQRFALDPTAPPARCRDLTRLQDSLRFGQYGIDYVHLQPDSFSLAQLICAIEDADYAGIWVLDAGSMERPLTPDLLRIADLLLVLHHPAGSLAPLAKIRRIFTAAGGAQEDLLLLPTDVPSKVPPRQEQLFRFAAQERDLALTASDYVHESRLQERLGEQGSILTRIADRPLHQQLQQLAQQLLGRYSRGTHAQVVQRRLQCTGRLGEGLSRLPAACPFCGRSALRGTVQWIECFPQRNRALIHRDCLLPLMPASLRALQTEGNILRLELREQSALPGMQLHLVLFDPQFQRLECQALPLEETSAWGTGLMQMSRHRLFELFGTQMLIYPAQPLAQLYRASAREQRRNCRRRLLHPL